MSVHFTKENVFVISFLLTKQNTITYTWTKHNDMDKISEGKDPTAFLLDTTTGCACWSGIRSIALQTGIKNVCHRYLVHFSKKGKDQISVIHTLCACLQGNCNQNSYHTIRYSDCHLIQRPNIQSSSFLPNRKLLSYLFFYSPLTVFACSAIRILITRTSILVQPLHNFKLSFLNSVNTWETRIRSKYRGARVHPN